MSDNNSKLLHGWTREIDKSKNVRYVSMSGRVFYNRQSIVDYLSLPTNCKCWQSGIINFTASFDFNPGAVVDIAANGGAGRKNYKCKEWISRLSTEQYEDLLRQLFLYFAIFSSADLDEIYYIVKYIKKDPKDSDITKEERSKINNWLKEFQYDNFMSVNGSLWLLQLTEDQVPHAIFELYQAKHLPFNFESYMKNREPNFNPVIVSGPQRFPAVKAQSVLDSSAQKQPIESRIKSSLNNNHHDSTIIEDQNHCLPAEQISLDSSSFSHFEHSVSPEHNNNRILEVPVQVSNNHNNNNNSSYIQINPSTPNGKKPKARNNSNNSVKKQSPIKSSLQPMHPDSNVISPTRQFYYDYNTNNFLFPLPQSMNKPISSNVDLSTVPTNNSVIILNNNVNHTFNNAVINPTITFDSMNNTNKRTSPTKRARTISNAHLNPPNLPVPSFSIITTKNDTPPTAGHGLSTILFNSVPNSNHSLSNNKHPINLIPLSVVQNIPQERIPPPISQTPIIPEMAPKPKRTPRARGKRLKDEPIKEHSSLFAQTILQHPNQSPVQVGFPDPSGKIVPIFNGVFVDDGPLKNGSSIQNHHKADHEISEPGFESVDASQSFKISSFTILNEYDENEN